VHVAFALDRSGSMGGRKIELAKQAVSEALGFLGATDRFAIITFDDFVERVTPATFATDAAIREARAQLRHVEARGSTALAEGWLTACGEIAAAPRAANEAAPIARCFLLTDGQANIGETSTPILADHARELCRRGVRTVPFGLGDGYHDEFLQALSSAGGGNFYFVEAAPQIHDLFTSELGEALETASRDVRLVLRAPGAKCLPVTAYAIETPGDDVTVVRLGDLVSDQIVELVVEIAFPEDVIGTSVEVQAEVLARHPGVRTGDSDHSRGSARFTYADHRANDQQARDRGVDLSVAEAWAARARWSAVVENRAGDFPTAVRTLLETAQRIRRDAHDDPALLGLADALVNDAKTYAEPMAEMERKRSSAAAASALKGRDRFGKARKH
jgi:Ca-activated chloride channel family protein